MAVDNPPRMAVDRRPRAALTNPTRLRAVKAELRPRAGRMAVGVVRPRTRRHVVATNRRTAGCRRAAARRVAKALHAMEHSRVTAAKTVRLAKGATGAKVMKVAKIVRTASPARLRPHRQRHRAHHLSMAMIPSSHWRLKVGVSRCPTRLAKAVEAYSAKMAGDMKSGLAGMTRNMEMHAARMVKDMETSAAEMAEGAETRAARAPRACAQPFALILIITLIGLCASCSGGDTVYHDFRALSPHGWDRADTLTFTARLTDSAALYQIAIDLRHTDRYPYGEFCLRLLPAPAASDTLRISLIDSRARWTTRGWAGLYQGRIPAGTFRPDSAGTYTFRMVHAMPDSILQGISDLGLLIRRVP